MRDVGSRIQLPAPPDLDSESQPVVGGLFPVESSGPGSDIPQGPPGLQWAGTSNAVIRVRRSVQASVDRGPIPRVPSLQPH